MTNNVIFFIHKPLDRILNCFELKINLSCAKFDQRRRDVSQQVTSNIMGKWLIPISLINN